MAGSPKRQRSRPAFDPAKMRVSAPLFEQATPPDLSPDPASAEAPGAPSASPGDRRYTVTQLAGLINGALRDGLPARISVVGEVSGFTDRTHWWFRLKDAGAVVECVMFASAARKHRPAPRDGDEVVASGRVEHYAKQGRTQLYVDRLAPIGAGALDQKFRALCDELRALGSFDPARKRPLPSFPRRVAVITSRTGAAVQDVIDTFRRRAPFVALLIVDARVQGDGAGRDIAAAIERIGRDAERLGVDAILVTRGGGSIEDLWAFNERIVADAILGCAIPVVAAIGHETDTTIAELVSDERAATPTQAAMRLAPDREALAQQIGHLRGRLHSALVRRVQHESARIESLASRPVLRDPRGLIADRRERVAHVRRRAHGALIGRLHRDSARLERLGARLAKGRPEAVFAERTVRLRESSRRLRRGLTGLVLRRRDALAALARTLEATGPLNVLRRGYTLTLRADGALIRGPADTADGDLITTIGSDGRLLSTVGDHTDPDATPPAAGPSLFDPHAESTLDDPDSGG